jgi:hypothetical protein
MQRREIDVTTEVFDTAVPDGRIQELTRAQEILRQQDAARLELNEGGRSHDSSERGNPPGAVHGVPKPSLRGTWR